MSPRIHLAITLEYRIKTLETPCFFGNALFLKRNHINHVTKVASFLFYYYPCVQTPATNVSFLRYRYR